MDRRRQIRMSEAELAAFLDAQRTLVCATLGPRGRPHLAALWYVPAGGRLDCWTYAASQKARNLDRDPRATLLTEAGTAYPELRGVSMECDAELVRDPDAVLDIGVALAVRYGATAGPELRASLAAQAVKRVGVRFTPTRVSSWDHRKLGGG
jgi:PPOX class probable F420-dependent enzyme